MMEKKEPATFEFIFLEDDQWPAPWDPSPPEDGHAANARR